MSGTTPGAGPSLCVVGSFMMDLIAYAPRRPEPGETLTGNSFLQTPGGKGFNQAIAAARSGVATAMVGRVGQDLFGDQFLAALAEAGVDNSGVGQDPAVGTGVGLPVVSDDGQNSIIIIPQANHAMTAAMVREQAALIEQANVLLLQLELPMEAAIEAARIAKAAGVRVVLNPAPFAALPDELVDLCDMVVPNEVELANWTGIDVSDPEQVAAVAGDLGQHHDLDLLVTLGARGVLVAARGAEPVLVPGHRVEVKDTIGAGDIFCGYLCARLSTGGDLVEAVHYANAASALAVTRTGGASSAPTHTEVEAFLASTTPREDQS